MKGISSQEHAAGCIISEESKICTAEGEERVWIKGTCVPWNIKTPIEEKAPWSVEEGIPEEGQADQNSKEYIR